MPFQRRSVLVLVVCLAALVALPVQASNPRFEAPRGLSASSKSIRPLAATVLFSGSFGYSIGGGQAIMKADTVTNPAGTASGPLRFSLWFTSAPFPSAGYSTASYDITPSLA